MSCNGEYFIRHTNEMTVSYDAVSRLYSDDLIGIHFEDVDSINSRDYEDPAAKKAVACFRDLNTDGGYIWAQYHRHAMAKVGEIEKGSFSTREVARRPESGSSTRAGSKAILKTLRMTRVREIAADEMQALRAVRPRRGTIAHWGSANGLLRAIVNKERVDLSWECLSPSQQEVAFSEFLRDHKIAGLPRLQMLLMPVGRTLKDVDLYGVAEDGKKLFAQVTFDTLADKRTQEKANKLRDYIGNGNHLLLLCRTSSGNPIRQVEGVWVISTSITNSWLEGHRQFTSMFVDDLNDRTC